MPDLAIPVLVLDDYASMRRTIRSMLHHIGFTNITEDDGSGALALIRNVTFGLIISDLLMTAVSGLEILRQVRGEPRSAGTLFVMVTGAAHQDVVLAARGLRVDGYLVKPFDSNTLKRKLFALLGRAAPAHARIPVDPAAAAEPDNAELAAAGLDGVLYRVEKPVLRATALPDGRQAPARSGDERRDGRRYKRFVEPALHVLIGERSYRTIAWSISGFVIGGYAGALQPGKQIKITMQVEGGEEERESFSDHVVVVRNDRDAGCLALRSTSQSSATLKVLEYLTVRQQSPVEASHAPAAAPSGP